MDEVGKIREEFVGRSLAYIRILVGAKAHYPTAKVAAESLYLRSSAPVPLGSICWYDSEPYGNCGLYVGDRLVLTITEDGATLVDMHNPVLGGPWLGWCPSSALRLAGEKAHEQS